MAATLNVLATFDNATNGYEPQGGLVIDGQGNIYGTTTYGGTNGDGTVFEIPAGTGQITVLHSFAGTDGKYPYGSLTTDSAGNIYGTTYYGGDNESGTVFEIVGARHNFTQIASLGGNGGQGYYAGSGVYVDPTGAIYGTTDQGGANGTGTVYQIPITSSTPTETSFPAGAASSHTNYGPFTYSAPIQFGTNLYSTTLGDETTANPGTIFSYDYQSATPTITTLATFDPATTGYEPNAGVIADSAGNLYGTTALGGANGLGAVFEYDAATHSLQTLASFDSTTGDGVDGNLIRDSAGNLFGETYEGGVNGNGTIFELKAGASTINVVYDFQDNGDGSGPNGGLIADQAGNLYGVAYRGGDAPGASGDGTVFEVQNSGFVCFASGTLIRTMRGEDIIDVAVEALHVGDLAVTASGAHRPIRWLGHRTVDCSSHPEPRSVWPVRVAAHAFGDGLPSTDLFLSAGHSVRVSVMDDIFMPIGKLINGATIARHPVDQVTYWHVELDSHDVLIANGLPAESFLDCGNRAGLLEQDGDYDRATGPRTPADFCLPYIDRGPELDIVRTRLEARAARLGWTLTHDLDMHLVVDGLRVDADIDGSFARFIFPAAAKAVTLASATYVPSDHLAHNLDDRHLGLSINGLTIEDGLRDHTQLAVDDPRLAGLFHPEEPGACHRFTDGHLALPPSLWAGCRTHVILRVGFDPASGRRWLTPGGCEAANVVPLRAAG